MSLRCRLAFILLAAAFSAGAQNEKQIIVLFPNTTFIQEIYYVRDARPDVRDGDYFSFFEGYVAAADYHGGKVDEDRVKGIKTHGSYYENRKDSVWTIYYPPGYNPDSQLNEIMEEGAYLNDRKIGTWYTFLEQGKVIRRHDYEQDIDLDVIVKPRFIYPPKAQAYHAQGLVAVKIIYERCVVKKYKILKDPGFGCARAVIAALREAENLRKKYGINEVDCSKKDEVYTTIFKL